MSDFNQALKDLPADMDQLYQQRMQSFPLDHRNWLSIALRWLICGDGEITATLIADEIEHKYLSRKLHRSAKANEDANQIPERSAQNTNEEQVVRDTDGGDQSDCKERPSISALKDFGRDFLKFT